MRGEEFLSALEYIDPKLIEAADQPPVKKKKRRVPIYILSTAVAACFCVLIGLGIWNVVLSGNRAETAATYSYSAETSAGAEEAFDTAEAEEPMMGEAKATDAFSGEEAAVEESMDIGAMENEVTGTVEAYLSAEDEVAKRFVSAFENGTELQDFDEDLIMRSPLLLLTLEHSDGTKDAYLLYANAIVTSGDAPESLVRIDEEVYDEVITLFTAGNR